MLTWAISDLSRAMLPIGAGNKTLAQGFNTIGKLLPALGAGARPRRSPDTRRIPTNDNCRTNPSSRLLEGNANSPWA